MDILVTGATGFIGSHLIELLLDKGYHVRCLVRQDSNLSYIDNKKVEFVYGDIFNMESLEPAVKGTKYIFHLAAVLKRKILKIVIPSFILDARLFLKHLYNVMTKTRSVVNRRRLKIHPQHWVCDGSKAKKELGYQTNTSLVEGIKETVAWYLKHRWI